MKEQIANNFKYHSPTPDQVERYANLRKEFKWVAEIVDTECPDSREKSIAITKLEEAVMWANASIARNE